jgi:sialate O-acetylesterase
MNFVKAQAKIEGKKLVVFSDEVKKPVAVRYAWSNDAEATLFNKEGLPASTFKTDDWSK